MPRFLASGVLAMLSGCASSGAITLDEIAHGRDVTLAVGQGVLLPDAASLRYVGIANDSRCPPDVQCVRAGDADVLFDFTPTRVPTSRVTLNTGRTLSAVAGAWQLRLVALAPGDEPNVTLHLNTVETGVAP